MTSSEQVSSVSLEPFEDVAIICVESDAQNIAKAAPFRSSKVASMKNGNAKNNVCVLF